MKKYRLIKEYPGSPELGTIEIPIGNIHQMSNGNYGYKISSTPEFWEEIVEKDYEILSYITISNAIWTKSKNNKDIWQNDIDGCTFLLVKLLESNLKAQIHSVKRLSDNEIFTIGDKIRGHILEEIFIAPSNKNDIVLSCKDLRRALYLIEDKHLKIDSKVLFKTEDGVDIFDYSKDHFYYVKKESFKLCENLKVINSNVTFKYEPKKELYFSTKEKAEQYILMNKPCLSLNEVKFIINTHRNKTNGLIEIEKLVKLKINDKT